MSEYRPLTPEQKDRMITETYHAVAGHPLDPKRPGLVAIVERHDKTLYGESGKNGINGQAKKLQKWIWMGMGVFIALQALWAWLLAMKSAGK